MHPIRRSLQAFVTVASLALVSLPAQDQPPQPPRGEPPEQAKSERPKVALTLGVYSFKRPTDVFRDFAPAIDELNRALTLQLGRPANVELRVAKEYDECLQRFVAGQVDLVRFGPASYVLAKKEQPDVQLLVAEQEDGKKRCKGVIVVRKDSTVRTISDLRGRTFAFGDENSTIGRYLSQARLVGAGVFAEDLAGYRYLERHDKVFKAVELGDYEAGAVHISTFEDNNTKGQLRTIDVFDNVGKPWIARAGLQPDLVDALRRTLLEMKSPQALKALGVHGFLPTSDEDFDFVRKGMQQSERFVKTQSGK